MDMNQVHQECVSQLRAFTESIGCKEVIVGLSGGLDSSVTAALCVDAFGGGFDLRFAVAWCSVCVANFFAVFLHLSDKQIDFLSHP